MDVEANTMLGTIFQRLGDLVSSDQAVERALQNNGISASGRAEIRTLMGRNAKNRWEQSWANLTTVDAAQKAALASQYLENSFDLCRAGFIEDRNHFYSGLNALAMVTMRTELAQAQPRGWEDSFDTGEEASAKVAKAQRIAQRPRRGCAAGDRVQANGLATQRQKRRVGRYQHRGSHLFDLHATESGRPVLQEGAHRRFGSSARRRPATTAALPASRDTKGEYSSWPRKHRAGGGAGPGSAAAGDFVYWPPDRRACSPDAALSGRQGRAGARDDPRCSHEHQGQN